MSEREKAGSGFSDLSPCAPPFFFFFFFKPLPHSDRFPAAMNSRHPFLPLANSGPVAGGIVPPSDGDSASKIFFFSPAPSEILFPSLSALPRASARPPGGPARVTISSAGDYLNSTTTCAGTLHGNTAATGQDVTIQTGKNTCAFRTDPSGLCHSGKIVMRTGQSLGGAGGNYTILVGAPGTWGREATSRPWLGTRRMPRRNNVPARTRQRGPPERTDERPERPERPERRRGSGRGGAWTLWGGGPPLAMALRRGARGGRAQPGREGGRRGAGGGGPTLAGALPPPAGAVALFKKSYTFAVVHVQCCVFCFVLFCFVFFFFSSSRRSVAELLRARRWAGGASSPPLPLSPRPFRRGVVIRHAVSRIT